MARSITSRILTYLIVKYYTKLRHVLTGLPSSSTQRFLGAVARFGQPQAQASQPDHCEIEMLTMWLTVEQTRNTKHLK